MGKIVWRHIEEHDVSASRGLASDEFLMHLHAKPEYAYPASLKLYTYRNYCALCGRFQDLQAEIDLTYCRQNGVEFSRRLTGGGAIIMGHDQLGICLSSHSSNFQWKHIRELYTLFSEPIIKALEQFGIQANFRSKNDLEVNGKKIAGLGIYLSEEGGIQFHSSLLLDLDIPQMLKVLNIPIQKYADKRMIHSVEQRMTAVRRESGLPISMVQLIEALRQAYSRAFDISLRIEPFSDGEKEEITKLEKDRYQSEAWLFQHSPQEDMTGMSLKKTAAGLLRTYIGLKGDNIKSVLITGDFMDRPEVFTEIESRLKWSVLDKNKIEEIVKQSMQTHTASEVKAEEITDAIWLAAQRAHAAHRYTYKGSCYYPEKDLRFSIADFGFAKKALSKND
jgi:lipoate---protein ligase